MQSGVLKVDRHVISLWLPADDSFRSRCEMETWISGYRHPHVVRTTNMTDVMLTGSGGIKADAAV